MKWNVYIENINPNEIKVFNIFDHGGFREDVEKYFKKYKNKEEFAEQIKREVRYYFWSKCEWELVIEITEDNHIFLKPWVGCREPEKVRIDVTDDIGFDWRGFAEKHIERQIYGNKAKIDVYDQVNYVWDEFVEYCWNNRKNINKKL